MICFIISSGQKHVCSQSFSCIFTCLKTSLHFPKRTMSFAEILKLLFFIHSLRILLYIARQKFITCGICVLLTVCRGLLTLLPGWSCLRGGVAVSSIKLALPPGKHVRVTYSYGLPYLQPH